MDNADASLGLQHGKTSNFAVSINKRTNPKNISATNVTAAKNSFFRLYSKKKIYIIEEST